MSSVLVPPEARSAAAASRMVLQQASIVGNMQARGLLEDAESRTFVEMGAGKGFLSLTLAGAAGGGGGMPSWGGMTRSFRAQGRLLAPWGQLRAVHLRLRAVLLLVLPGTMLQG